MWGGVGGGAHAFVACLSHYTIDHAPLSRRSTASTNIDTSNMWALITSVLYSTEKRFANFVPFHLSPTIAIVFSLLSRAPPPPCHIRLFPSSLLSHPVAPCTLCELYSPLLDHTGISMHLLPALPGYWYASFVFLADPGPLHEIADSVFWRSPLGRPNTFSFLSLRSIPRVSLSVSQIPPYFLEPVFPFFPLCLVPPKPSGGHLLFLVSPYILPCFLDYLCYPTLVQLALWLLSPIKLFQL